MNKAIDEEKLLAIEPRTKEKPVFRSISKIILTNELYTGKTINGKEEVAGFLTGQSNKHLFSTLIRCKECGWSFRRTVRTYKNTNIRWVCSGHNGKGADSCPNAVSANEDELINVLQVYFNQMFCQKKKAICYVVDEFQRVYKVKDENIEYEKELKSQLNKLTDAWRTSRGRWLSPYSMIILMGIPENSQFKSGFVKFLFCGQGETLIPGFLA